MIKVGQIYKVIEDNYKFIITHKINEDRFCILFEDGDVMDTGWAPTIQRDAKLIAEYPTWQEAVNSKEFNND